MTEGEESFFCERCGDQLVALDDIQVGLCPSCQSIAKENKKKEGSFECEICGKQLHSMDEISQGLCNLCKVEIIKKIR
jgi:ribosomal protein L34E